MYLLQKYGALAEKLGMGLQNPADGSVTRTRLHFMNDESFLRRAVKLAKQSSEPVPCACVLVRDGVIIAEAYNSQRADKVAIHHAEIKAIKIASERTGTRKLTDGVAYCSCEPCVMCLTALSLANIERIVYNDTMAHVSGDGPMGTLDSVEFAGRYLNFVPKLERILL